MLTIKLIKEQLRLIQTEKEKEINSSKNFQRLLELKNAELDLNKELVKLLETQLNKKNNVRRAG